MSMRKNWGRILGLAALAALVWVGVWSESRACTIGVVAGKGTPDGCPLLWKNRDTLEGVNNEVRFFADSPVFEGYIAIVTSDSEETTKVWSGINDVGFSINNALVSTHPSGDNGILMKQALMTCATVDDFETLVHDWTAGQVSGNFGVVDAHGGATMFEVWAQPGSVQYWRTDAASQPDRFVVMANFNRYGSGSGGQERKARAEALFREAQAGDGLTHEFILRYVARDLAGNGPPVQPNTEWGTNLFINRYMTRSATVVHGVRPYDTPRLSTFWTMLGEPEFSAALPLFSYAHSVPAQLSAPPSQIAPMDEVVIDRELRSYLDNEYDTTIRPYPLWYKENGHPPIQSYSLSLEDEAFARAFDQIDYWRRVNCVWYPEDMQVFEDKLASLVYGRYYIEEPGPLKQPLVLCGHNPWDPISATSGAGE